MRKQVLTWSVPIRECLKMHPEDLALSRYPGVRNFYQINSQKLQIGIGIGKFSIMDSEEFHIGNFWGRIPEGR